MALGTAVSRSGSGGENISHFTAIRMRIVGQGYLQMTMTSMDNIVEQPLIPFTLSSATNKEPTRLCNFNQQRAYLRFETVDIDEQFTISRIIIFAKEVATGYPGNE